MGYYEDRAEEKYAELCMIVGDVVFALSAEGFDTKKIQIADVLRTELAKVGKWEEDQIRLIELAIRILEE